MKKPPYLEPSQPPGRSQESAQRTGQDSPGKSAELKAAGRMRQSSGGPEGERLSRLAVPALGEGKQLVRLRGNEGREAWLPVTRMTAGEGGDTCGAPVGFPISATSRERTWKDLKPGHDTKFGFFFKDYPGCSAENGLSGDKGGHGEPLTRGVSTEHEGGLEAGGGSRDGEKGTHSKKD